MSTRVSLAELAAADIRLRPSEAVAIVVAVCHQHSAGAIRGIPSPGVIRLTRDGDVVAEGPITTAQDEVARAALLLNDLLSGLNALPEYRASGALRLVVERALGTIDLPPYASLNEFCSAVSRFSTDDVREVAQGLFAAWERARSGRAFKTPHRVDLTISDVRRARRATGLSLGQLATVAEVPPARLRDLEWGYMRDWPPTPEGRAQVIRYARAAGLDETIVLSIAWPMILERVGAGVGDSSECVALVRSGPQALTVVQPARAARSRRWRSAMVAAAATIALIGAFVLGARSSDPGTSPQDAVQVGASDLRTPPVSAPDGRLSRAALPPLDGLRVDAANRVEPGMTVRPAVVLQDVEPRPAGARANVARKRESPRQAAATRAKSRPAPARREEPRKDSIFERELLRIVIR